MKLPFFPTKNVEALHNVRSGPKMLMRIMWLWRKISTTTVKMIIYGVKKSGEELLASWHIGKEIG
jgi:hypothetical protein